MLKIKHVLIIMVGLFLSACGYHQAATQKSDAAYLLFIGKPGGEVVEVDTGTRFVLGADTESYNLNGKTATKVVITPGTHTVKMTREGRVVMHRKLFVSDGNQYEIVIP